MGGVIGEVRMFAGSFAPRSWAFCDGKLMDVSSNSALFSILGTIYGGDGRSTFALPDLRGRIPVGAGIGPGLSPYIQGERGGQEVTTLTTLNMPSHNHNVMIQNPGSIDIPVNVSSGDQDESNPGAGVLANTGADNYASTASADAKYSGKSLPVDNLQVTDQPAGSGQSFSNIQPFLSIHFIICLDGIYPSRS